MVVLMWLSVTRVCPWCGVRRHNNKTRFYVSPVIMAIIHQPRAQHNLSRIRPAPLQRRSITPARPAISLRCLPLGEHLTDRKHHSSTPLRWCLYCTCPLDVAESGRRERNPRVSTNSSLGVGNERTDAGREGPNCLKRPNSQAQTGAGKIHFPC